MRRVPGLFLVPAVAVIASSALLGGGAANAQVVAIAHPVSDAASGTVPAAPPDAPAIWSAENAQVVTQSDVPSADITPTPTNDVAAPGTQISDGKNETDAFMVVENGRYDLFTSRDGPGPNIPVESGSAPGRWGPVTDALPELPEWATPSWAWAPDVHRFGDHYVLYFTTLLRGIKPSVMCIGDAVSSTAVGPYVALPKPFICQATLGGSIDPRTFVDTKGQLYMVWKSDQNARSNSIDTQIYSQPLSNDGLHLLGKPSVIFTPDEPWQGTIVEAPQLVTVEGQYYLFYSGGWFNQRSYAIGAAHCDGPLGPCTDTKAEPLLGSNLEGAGPGEESVYSDGRGFWMVYAPSRSDVPAPQAPRSTTVVRLGFGPLGPYVAVTPKNPADT